MTLVRVENLSKTYHAGDVEVQALRGIDFMIEPAAVGIICGDASDIPSRRRWTLPAEEPIGIERLQRLVRRRPPAAAAADSPVRQSGP